MTDYAELLRHLRLLARGKHDDVSIAADAAGAIIALLAERDALAQDAGRYRWLRDREIPEWLDLWHQNPDRIDAAIDAAMEGRNERD